jgi:hypothetical protein
MMREEVHTITRTGDIIRIPEYFFVVAVGGVNCTAGSA